MTRAAETKTTELLARIADALERLAVTQTTATPVERAEATAPALDGAEGWMWQAASQRLQPVAEIAAPPLCLLRGLDDQRDRLLANSRRFAGGWPANNALLWGARGMGKSSLVKAVHRAVAAECHATGQPAPALIEIHREDIASLPLLLDRLRGTARRVVILCDDLSFEPAESSYKSLKAVLEGGLAGRPENVIFYATSNRRHLMARPDPHGPADPSLHPGEGGDETVSLSDRFGLWLGFHACDQATYLDMAAGYAAHYGLPLPECELRERARAWAAGRGGRSGRVAWQFIQDLAGELGVRLEG